MEKVEKGLKAKSDITTKAGNFFAEHLSLLITIVGLLGVGVYEYCSTDLLSNQITQTKLVELAIKCVFVMLFWSNYLVTGKTSGKKNNEFISSRNYLTKVYNSIVMAGKLNEVGKFVCEYKEKKLAEDRKNWLYSVGIDYNDFLNGYQNLSSKEIIKLEYKLGKEPKEDFAGEKITNMQKKHILLALNAKPKILTEEELIGGEMPKYSRKVIPANESKLTKQQTATKVSRWLIITLLTTMWTVQLTASFTVESLGSLAMMLYVLIMAGVGGWQAGYQLVTSKVVKNLTKRADTLTIMCEQYNIQIKDI